MAAERLSAAAAGEHLVRSSQSFRDGSENLFLHDAWVFLAPAIATVGDAVVLWRGGSVSLAAAAISAAVLVAAAVQPFSFFRAKNDPVQYTLAALFSVGLPMGWLRLQRNAGACDEHAGVRSWRAAAGVVVLALPALCSPLILLPVPEGYRLVGLSRDIVWLHSAPIAWVTVASLAAILSSRQWRLGPRIETAIYVWLAAAWIAATRFDVAVYRLF